MRKYLTIIMISLMIFGLSGCSKNDCLAEAELSKMSLSQLDKHAYKLEKKLLSMDGVPDNIRAVAKQRSTLKHQNEHMLIEYITSLQNFIELQKAVNKKL